MLPVQFAVRKRITLRDGSTAWRLGGTQKKDGFFAGLRKHVSRRGFPTEDRNTLQEFIYLYQWCYWRTRDPEKDALRGCHDKSQPPVFDLLKELGDLRRRLRVRLGDEALAQDNWLYTIPQDQWLSDLPSTAVPTHRLQGKTLPPAPALGSRGTTKPADWPRGTQSKGHVMETTKRRQQEHANLRKRPASDT